LSGERGRCLRKDRYTLLSRRLLEELRHYERVYQPTPWLFPQRHRPAPMVPSSALRIYHAAACRNDNRGKG